MEKRCFELVEYVFCDSNCKQKICSKTKRYYAFNSISEFFNIVSKLDLQENGTDVFLKDEDEGLPHNTVPYDLYY